MQLRHAIKRLAVVGAVFVGCAATVVAVPASSEAVAFNYTVSCSVSVTVSHPNNTVTDSTTKFTCNHAFASLTASTKLTYLPSNSNVKTCTASASNPSSSLTYACNGGASTSWVVNFTIDTGAGGTFTNANQYHCTNPGGHVYYTCSYP